MENKKAHIYNLIIVDESGSMSYLEKATLNGINSTINTIRKAQKEFVNTQVHTLSLVTFSSGSGGAKVQAVINNEPISQVKTFKDYTPNGGTPLYDAIGFSLSTLYNYIKADKDATAVVTILTDGLENSSTDWTVDALRSFIEKLKAEGWSFSYMGSDHDVKQVTDLLSIDNVIEFSHNDTGVDHTWVRESSSRRAYYEKMNTMYGEDNITADEIMERKRNFAREYYGARVTPDRIRHLNENEIFVFGSNSAGFHNGGAAQVAMIKFGAVWGQGEGLQGKSYAIPTTGFFENMVQAINRFIDFAMRNPQKRFLVTRIGCGNAGYMAEQIAPYFKECVKLENVALPAEFWTALGLRMF